MEKNHCNLHGARFTVGTQCPSVQPPKQLEEDSKTCCLQFKGQLRPASAQHKHSHFDLSRCKAVIQEGAYTHACL